ncbi:AAA family ATPase [Beijerinckia indica]|uniref:ATPase AAA-type core domain-containing protein n=1 Tax=Beijerinckia indica subsp. indica (strain ATCC 9039 / DSM 1715 / NCIMB 8712) TaxID=395963 RepID=B2IHM4_BEII9|nr:ATP-binding protein [Beijerinckia indica]ACB94545.1 conserved hypothetical protein [Beijerinckia indica subsp. indica ATCC 9039]
MKLKVVRPHLSIQPFDEVELPDLTILVGLNGSGKSHLLQAIEIGAAETDLFPSLPGFHAGHPATIPPGSIVRIENSFITADIFSGAVLSSIAGGHNPNHQLNHRLLNFDILRKTVLADSLSNLENALGCPISSYLSSEEDPWQFGYDAILTKAGITVGSRKALEIKEAFDDAQSKLTIHLTQPGHPLDADLHALRLLVKDVAEILRISPLEVTKMQVLSRNCWGGFSIFEPQISLVIARYRDAMAQNDLYTCADRRNGTSNGLSDNAFREHYGHPPWELVSEFIQSFGLAYRVTAPALELSQPYTFSLERTDTGATVQFGALSSGEKVLLRFALSLFPFDPLRISIIRPRLLLLDEMDASLHPEMAYRWLKGISDGLVQKLGIKCILTTHSPTTVALADEESLFQKVPGTSQPQKISKQKALNGLTYGVPILSIDFSGRRQVFVESDTDAAIYETIYTLIKTRLNMPRELNFISTGMRIKDNNEINAGCTIVTNIVQNLAGKGNQSVFGLIDWDGTATPDQRIKVLASGTHYTLENVLLDPLLISFLLIRDGAPADRQVRSYSNLDTLNGTELQALADTVQDVLVLPGDDSNKRLNTYISGQKIEVKNSYTTMSGHDLETILADKFPSLKRYTKNRGHLVRKMVNTILLDYPGFCPAVIRDIFQEISSAHIE